MPERPSHRDLQEAPGQHRERALLLEVYRRLYQRYGPQHWWPAQSRLEVIVGAILTQAAAWGNVEKAIQNLKGAGAMSWERLRDIPLEELAALIRPCGYFNTKARKLKAFVEHLWARYDGDLDAMFDKGVSELRQELLSIWGIGQETADDIIVYAAYKPSFVIDTYTVRILERLGLARNPATYQHYQELFHQNLPHDTLLFNEYHALLDRHAKEACRKTAPQCQGCCLLDLCPTGQAAVATG